MMSDYAKALGEVVLRERKAQKITQAQLAELIGTTEQTIRKTEHGNSNLQMSVLFPLIRALHIDPVEVFYPETSQERSAKKQLDMLIADFSDDEINLMLPILQASLEALRSKEKIPMKK